VDRRRGHHRGRREGEPPLQDDVAQLPDADHVEQGRAEIQHQPEDADEGAGQRQLDAMLPGDLEIARIGCDDPALGIRGGDQVMRDEQHRRGADPKAEGRPRPAPAFDRPAGIVDAQPGEDQRRDDRPGQQCPQAEGPEADKDDQRHIGDRQGNGGEQGPHMRHPDPLICEPP
jgi:hypothetical protein